MLVASGGTPDVYRPNSRAWVRVSTDGGQNWIQDNNWGSIYDLFFLDTQRGWAGGNGGVAYLIGLSAGAAETPKVFAAIFVLTLIGMVYYWLVIVVEKRVLHYMPSRGTTGF